mmetsp:Transcript_75530/g.125943  ORF Transcript_75530/g.125943 Transcript_75530/m.125943 type:complete len:318 (-) Transcript_75530:154-1107(-)
MLLVLLKRLPPQLFARLSCVCQSWRSTCTVVILALKQDLSLGSEAVPIPCRNEVDHDPVPCIVYTVSCTADACTLRRLQSCDSAHCLCSGVSDCRTAEGCTCVVAMDGILPYDDAGRLLSLVNTPSLHLAEEPRAQVIFECTSHCACNASCRNRVVSRGLQKRVEVFKTHSRGWGLRSCEKISRGTFVCEYAGEIINSAEADRRRAQRGTARNYIMCVREHVSGGRVLRTTIDPTTRGNVGRFINHSCEANLSVHIVRAGSLVPRVALFARRDINVAEELTMSYGEADCTDVAHRIHPCLCGAHNCKGVLPSQTSFD